MLPQWIIEAKRDGKVLAEADIRAFIEGYTQGAIPDYQMAALAMAITLRGMTAEETAVLTDAMMRSGDVIDLSDVGRPTADKHSTGGIGDKVSLVLAPLAAACDVAVPMISGRGLGITGGTLDKLESIPGYRTDLSIDAFRELLKTCGCAIIGQTARLAPADKKLYALRDVTGTVPSIPLIAASIMSKKLAEGAEALVMDVKHGRGAFMATPEQAAELGRTLVAIGRRLGRAMAARLTDMNQPLGRAAGNAVEVVEAVEALRGEGPDDLMDVTLALGVHMLRLAGRADSDEAARALLEQALASGAALDRFRDMVARQGGDTACIDDPSRLPRARHERPLPAPVGGIVTTADAGALGRACVALGAGRRRVEDRVDPAVGLTGIRKIGEQVAAGEPLAVIHANAQDALDQALPLLQEAFTLADAPVTPPPLLGEVIV